MTTATLPPLDPLFRQSAKRTRDIFESCPDEGLRDDEKSTRIRLSVKIHDEYRDFKELPPALLSQQGPVGPSRPRDVARKMITAGPSADNTSRMIAAIDNTPISQPSTFQSASKLSQALTLHKTTRTIKPTYHAPVESSCV
ncbi:hypothetical protein B0H14DRAFT_3141795 [Mycena olivaceomarginata]|nr:hypothetical protein B0H14DRAFT_3141795 [Mycena olivaceomarginata]